MEDPTKIIYDVIGRDDGEEIIKALQKKGWHLHYKAPVVNIRPRPAVRIWRNDDLGVGRPAKELTEYLQEQFRESFITNMWLDGLLCLRCDPSGIVTMETYPNETRCCLCGKDPLWHGPERPPKPEKLNRVRGTHPSAMFFDEILGTDV